MKFGLPATTYTMEVGMLIRPFALADPGPADDRARNLDRCGGRLIPNRHTVEVSWANLKLAPEPLYGHVDARMLRYFPVLFYLAIRRGFPVGLQASKHRFHRVFQQIKFIAPSHPR